MEYKRKNIRSVLPNVRLSFHKLFLVHPPNSNNYYTLVYLLSDFAYCLPAGASSDKSWMSLFAQSLFQLCVQIA
jgi:hypothetical protein